MANDLCYSISVHPVADAEISQNLGFLAFTLICVSDLTQKRVIQGKIGKTLTQYLTHRIL